MVVKGTDDHAVDVVVPSCIPGLATLTICKAHAIKTELLAHGIDGGKELDFAS